MAYATHSIKTKVLITAHVIESLDVGGKLAVRVSHDPNSTIGADVGFRLAPTPHGNGGERVQIADHSQAAYNLALYVISTGTDGSGTYYLLGENPGDQAGFPFSSPAGTGGYIHGSEPKPILGPLRTDGALGGSLVQAGTGSTQKTIITGGGSGGGSALTVKDEATTLSTAATTLTFTGSGVTATGTGAEKTITIPGGAGQNIWQGININNDGVFTFPASGQTPTTTTSKLNFVAGNNVAISSGGSTDPLNVTIGFEEKVQVVESAAPIDSETTIAVCLSSSHCTAIAESMLNQFHIEGNNTEFVNTATDTIRIPRSRYHYLETGDEIEYLDPDASILGTAGLTPPAEIGGLSYNTSYYVIKVGSLSPSPTSNDRYAPHYIKLAASQSDAIAGTEITLTSLGEGPFHRFRVITVAGKADNYQKYYDWWAGYTNQNSDFEGSSAINFDYSQYTGLINLPRPEIGKKLTLVIPWRASGIDNYRGVVNSFNPSTAVMGGYGALQFICSAMVDQDGNTIDAFIGNDLLQMNAKFRYFSSSPPGGQGITVTGDSFVLCEPEQYRLDYINMLRAIAAERDYSGGDLTPAQWHADAHSLKKGSRSPPDLGHVVIELVGVPRLAGTIASEGDPSGFSQWRPDIPSELNFISGNHEPTGVHYSNNAEVPIIGAFYGGVDLETGNPLDEQPLGFHNAFFPAIWAISTPNHITGDDFREVGSLQGIYTDYRAPLGGGRGGGGRGGAMIGYAKRSQYYHILAREFNQRGGL